MPHETRDAILEPFPSARIEQEIAHRLSRREIDLDELPRELARGDRVASVGRELHVIDAFAVDMY